MCVEVTYVTLDDTDTCWVGTPECPGEQETQFNTVVMVTHCQPCSVERMVCNTEFNGLIFLCKCQFGNK